MGISKRVEVRYNNSIELGECPCLKGGRDTMRSRRTTMEELAELIAEARGKAESAGEAVKTGEVFPSDTAAASS